MNWEEFQIEKESYRKAWELLKADYAEDLRKFLNKSYLTVICKWYFGIDDDLIAAAKECPEFFVNEGRTTKFLDIVQKIKVLEGLKSDHKKELEELIKEADGFDKKSILIIDGWSIGPVFPTVDMDYIQTIKKSPYCDQERTIMRAYSIAVVLKKVENL
jgi:hypothetical protein